MKAPALFAGALVCCLLNSCGTIYLKDVIQGSPFERSYDLNFRNAVAEGATAEEAHRTALLVAGEKHHVTWERRAAEEAEMEELKMEMGEMPDDSDMKLKWD